MRVASVTAIALIAIVASGPIAHAKKNWRLFVDKSRDDVMNRHPDICVDTGSIKKYADGVSKEFMVMRDYSNRCEVSTGGFGFSTSVYIIDCKQNLSNAINYVDRGIGLGTAKTYVTTPGDALWKAIRWVCNARV